MIFMNKIFTSIFFLYTVLISCQSHKGIKLSQNNILNINQLNSLKMIDTAEYSISKPNKSCVEINSKQSHDISTYCINYSSGKKNKTYAENKVYLSDYMGLKGEITERNMYDYSGYLISSEKLFSELVPKIHSNFRLPIENIHRRNGKDIETEKFEYAISFRDVLIQVMKIYLMDLDRQIPKLPDVSYYEDRSVSYENKQLLIIPKAGHAATDDVAECLLKMNLKLDIDKDFEENQWRIYFVKNKINYRVYIDEKTRTVSIEAHRESF